MRAFWSRTAFVLTFLSEGRMSPFYMRATLIHERNTMTIQRGLSAICVLTLVIATASDSARAGMTIVNNATATYVQTGSGSDFDFYTGTAIPSSVLLNASRDGYYSKNQLDYSQSASGAWLTNRLSQKRDGVSGTYSQGYASTLQFTVDAATTYDASGSFAATHAGAAGRVYMQAYLFDLTLGRTLFSSFQYSLNTASESFILGGSGGDYSNGFAGSLTGTLVAGHTYEWYFNSYIYADRQDSGASATGDMNLKLGDGGDGFKAVPEPAAVAMWSIAGALGLVITRRRKRIMVA
jgi:hypothetical protein